MTEETTQQVDIVNYEYDTVTVDETIAVVGASKSRKILRYPKLTGLSNADMQTKDKHSARRDRRIRVQKPHLGT